MADPKRSPYPRLRPLSLALVALVGCVALARPGRAQQPDSVTADSVPLYRLEGVTVSVVRAREELNRLPYALGLLGAEEIRGRDRTISLDEALAVVPGVQVDNRHNFALGNRISIRGFGARSQFGVRGLRIIQDGIPLTLPDGQTQLNNIDLAAAGRIEVIRGPAASLYGNASAGVISIQTQEPPARDVAMTFRALGGGYGDGRTYAKLDATGAGTVGAFRYVAHLGRFDSDGFRAHSEARQTQLNTRLGYRLDDASELVAVINYVDAPQAENPSSLSDSLARANPDTVRDIVLPTSECPASPASGGCQDLGEESRQLQAGLTYRRRLTHEHELSLTAYGVTRELDNRIPFTLIELDRRAGGVRAEYRFAPAADGRFTGMAAGFDLDHQDDDRLESDQDGAGTGPVTLDQDERVTALGVFANGGLRIVGDIAASLSVRYDRVRFAADDHLITPTDPDDSGDRSLDQWSPMLGLTWSRAAGFNLYANVGRTFVTPTTTELTDTLGGLSSDLEPERATHFEIGAKGAIAGRLSYSVALYHVEVEDQLIGFESADLQRVFFRNAGASDHDGIEVGLAALLADGLIASAAYTLSDFEFESFATADADFGGNEVPGVPPHRFHGRLDYRHPSGLDASFRVTAVDDYFVDNANTSRNAGYASVDLRAGYRSRVGRLSFEPFIGVDNVLDERYNGSVVVNAAGARYYEPAPGRNAYLGVRVGH